MAAAPMAVPRRWLDRFTSLTLRTKLALVYTGVFALGGALLLAANYAMVSASLEMRGVELATTAVIPNGDPAETLVAPAPTVPAPTGEAAPVTGWEETEPLAVLVDDYQVGVLSDLLLNSVLILLGVTLLAALAGWVIAGGPLRRLHRVTDAARTLSEHDLHSRLDLHGPDDEFRELGDTFDGMLSRLERAFDSQRRFVSNASHELRTPLSVQRAALEVPLAQDRVPDDLRPAFRRALDSVARSEALISGLLLLARSDRGLARTEEVDLAEVVQGAVAQQAGAAEEEGVDLRLDVEPAPVDGDPVLLEHLVRNLVENAVRYNTADGWVEVRVRTAAGRTVLRVTNSGTEVRDAEELFEPFHRGDAARLHRDRPGSGLGLSIVRSISTAHGAKATARARPEGGLVVTVGFPEL
ncbi:HAMP domain-containing sensor histidine kinase [Nocardiopsis sp. L17-MgMaSL7]|uniref:sensor histidine kinase n=1 Tax=Nocardiopsis sp. L17-MgMaSL7 TaxID=1938893 RepID=UPI000D937823|nr:ATP-binding protein [Nocardiopsis sp. L17-MgMaSL7]PWV48459.1 signal transduction histidine kinase [Nocardiopsis sp. L17-MgMaSL7]